MRPLGLIALVTATVLLSACGGAEEPPAPPGSPENPLVAKTTSEEKSRGRSNEASPRPTQAPGYQELVERQSRAPGSRFTPCNLVTRAQAQSILGAPVLAPVEAPQGPTCIYRGDDDSSFVTLAVQSMDFGRLTRQLRGRRAVDLADRPAYCGTYGQPMLYVSLPQDRVLTIAGPCGVARRFATNAVARLNG